MLLIKIRQEYMLVRIDNDTRKSLVLTLLDEYDIEVTEVHQNKERYLKIEKDKTHKALFILSFNYDIEII